MKTLWDLVEPVLRLIQPAPVAPARPARKPRPAASLQLTPAAPARPSRRSQSGRSQSGRSQSGRSASRRTKAQLYDDILQHMLSTYGVRVRKWRSSMSGLAWCVTYADGTVARLIEAPKPKSPLSLAIFLHEIGHHAIGFDTYKPRCLEEFHAWQFALRQMEALGVPPTQRVHTRVRRSLQYAVAKARRRGIKSIPAELAEFAA